MDIETGKKEVNLLDKDDKEKDNFVGETRYGNEFTSL